MGNQPSTSLSPRPIYTVRSDPWSGDNNTSAAAAYSSTSTEPADSDECHACAARADSTAVNPIITATNQTTTKNNSLHVSPSVSPSPTSPTTTTNTTTTTPAPCYAYSHSACPLNRAELGRAAWAHLHTMAAYYPLQPSATQQHDMRQLMTMYMQYYPCLYCRDRSMEEVERNPPRTANRRQLSEWVCEVHNEVNERLGKAVFDCQRVDERWRTGPTDGSCTGG